MKKLSCLLLLFLVMSTAFGQSFEGQITYSNVYDSKNPQVSSSQWMELMGAKQEYSIKGGNYKSVTDGTLVQWQLYVNKENKLYSKMSNSESALWNDASLQGDEVLTYKVNKEALEVMGYTCDELILTCKSGVQKYYYNSKFAVNPKVFLHHKFGNWYDFVSKSKALPLKMIIENEQFTMESTAVEIKSLKIDPKMFELPAGIMTEKSPY